MDLSPMGLCHSRSEIIFDPVRDEHCVCGFLLPSTLRSSADKITRQVQVPMYPCTALLYCAILPTLHGHVYLGLDSVLFVHHSRHWVVELLPLWGLADILC